MATSHRIVNILLVTGLLAVTVPLAQADEASEQTSYGSKIGNKALNGFTNIVSAPLEFPKNIVNNVNQTNFFYGVFGGFLKGIIHTTGRMGSGIADLITFPLPTTPIVHPSYIWDDFDVDTTYGNVFRLDKSQAAPEPVAAVEPPPAPVVAPIVSTPVAVPPRAPGYDQYQYGQDTNKKLDAVFTHKMKK